MAFINKNISVLDHYKFDWQNLKMWTSLIVPFMVIPCATCWKVAVLFHQSKTWGDLTKIETWIIDKGRYKRSLSLQGQSTIIESTKNVPTLSKYKISFLSSDSVLLRNSSLLLNSWGKKKKEKKYFYFYKNKKYSTRTSLFHTWIASIIIIKLCTEYYYPLLIMVVIFWFTGLIVS